MRKTIVGNTGTGKTVSMMKELDENLMKNPYKKALIMDTKDGTKDTIRYFVPNKQLSESK